MSKQHWLNLPLVAGLENSMTCLTAPQPCAKLMAMVPAAIEALHSQYSRAGPESLACVEAGLWLLADDLPTCHRICQDIPTPLGSAWHAIMHRREGDFSNSLYWWRRVGVIRWLDPRDGSDIAVSIGRSAGGDAVSQRLTRQLARQYDPAEFTRVVEASARGKLPVSADLLVRIARLEWLSLFGMSMAALGAADAGGDSRLAATQSS